MMILGGSASECTISYIFFLKKYNELKNHQSEVRWWSSRSFNNLLKIGMLLSALVTCVSKNEQHKIRKSSQMEITRNSIVDAIWDLFCRPLKYSKTCLSVSRITTTMKDATSQSSSESSKKSSFWSRTTQNRKKCQRAEIVHKRISEYLKKNQQQQQRREKNRKDWKQTWNTQKKHYR